MKSFKQWDMTTDLAFKQDDFHGWGAWGRETGSDTVSVVLGKKGEGVNQGSGSGTGEGKSDAW